MPTTASAPPYHTKSSITLPLAEVALVEGLRKRLRAKTRVEVVRRGPYLLRDGRSSTEGCMQRTLRRDLASSRAKVSPTIAGCGGCPGPPMREVKAKLRPLAEL